MPPPVLRSDNAGPRASNRLAGARGGVQRVAWRLGAQALTFPKPCEATHACEEVRLRMMIDVSLNPAARWRAAC